MGTPLRITRPTLSIGGQDNPALSAGLLSMAVVENTSGLCRCEATVGNWGSLNNSVGYLYFDRNIMDFGKAFRIKLGTNTIFDGLIVGLEAQYPGGQTPALRVLAEDRQSALRTKRRSRTFSNIGDAALFNQIANEHGLTPQINITGPIQATLEQVDQSDLALLYDRARAIDAAVWLDSNTLNARSHADPNLPLLHLNYGANLSEFTVLDELTPRRAMVTANDWATLSRMTVTLGDFITGVRTQIASGFGGIPGSQVEPGIGLNTGHVIIGRGIISGVYVLHVGTYVTLQNLGPLFSGDYFVSDVAYLFDIARGLRIEFAVERLG
jgi:hypothetical protein